MVAIADIATKYGILQHILCVVLGVDKRLKPKNFNPGDKVLLFNSRVKMFGHGKLRSKWQGPYHVIDTAPHGAITIQDDDGNTYKVNGQ